MKKVVLVEYIGSSNNKGQPIGHEIKVLKEYYELLQSKFETKVVVPENVCDLFNAQQIEKTLDNYIIVSDKKSLYQKINDTWKKYRNISKVLYKGDADIYWFYCTDFIIFLYLSIFRRYNRNVVCSLFRQYMGKDSFVGRIKNWIQREALQSIAGVIITNPNFQYPKVAPIYIPDYIYDVQKYDKYLHIEKEKKVVCLGTMNKFKLLEETIAVFNEMNYPLEIAGKFYDEEWQKSLQIMCRDNITVQDIYLSDEEYLQKIAGAQYCIIPYDTNLYKNRTSGVLLECIFLRTIPITFNSILEENSIQGLGIDKLKELTDKRLESYNLENFQVWCDDRIKNQFGRNEVQRTLVNGLENIINK